LLTIFRHILSPIDVYFGESVYLSSQVRDPLSFRRICIVEISPFGRDDKDSVLQRKWSGLVAAFLFTYSFSKEMFFVSLNSYMSLQKLMSNYAHTIYGQTKLM